MTTLSKKEQIIQASINILSQAGAAGKKYSDLMELLEGIFPDFPRNTIHGTVWKLHKETDEIKKSGRGQFIHKSYLSTHDMDGDGSSTLSDFLNRKEYNIIIEYLEEFRADFETVEIVELSGLDRDSFNKFNFLLQMSKTLNSINE